MRGDADGGQFRGLLRVWEEEEEEEQEQEEPVPKNSSPASLNPATGHTRFSYLLLTNHGAPTGFMIIRLFGKVSSLGSYPPIWPLLAALAFIYLPCQIKLIQSYP